MWNSASAIKNSPASAVIMAGAVMFQTHAGVISHPTTYDVLHDQNSSNYDNGRWASYNFHGTKPSKEKQLLGISDIISFVKVSLGLPNKDIASIFGVTRQTLHSYATEAEISQSMKSSTRDRVIALHEIIKAISPLLPHSPGAMSKNFTIEGSSLLDLLTSETLDTSKILHHSQLLADKMNKIPASHSKDGTTLFNLTRSV
ncbi:hypothetical protein [Aeromonas hydrophila]|uniref:hypothetical protein n=1 Tax=Aeromonas hydrophila TaxID=644 RepID=UPI003D209416